MRVKSTIIFVFCCFSLFASPRKKEVMDYIQSYKAIAVKEMHLYGIPASIKLAQAVLESNAGTSDLAMEANNHFGIKCGNQWDGPTYYKKDDDRDHRGKLIPSCFRVFESAESSYSAHSHFLLDPTKSFRYGPLFELDKTDYRSWAWGLRKAGYATNPAYANLLINIIETYGLYTFDYYEDSNVKYVRPEDLVAKPKDIRSHKSLENDTNKKIVQRPEPGTKTSAVERMTMINKREALIARKGQTMEQLAKKYDVSVSSIVKYNDLDLDADDYLHEGAIVFLEKKKRKYKGNTKSHTVREGESLYDISQKYGIRISALARKNRLDKDDIPIPGEKIILRGARARGDKIPLTYDDVEIVESKDISKPVMKHQWESIQTEPQTINEPTPVEKEDHEQTEQVKNDEEVVKTFDLDLPDLISSNSDTPSNNTVNEKKEVSFASNTIQHKVEKGETLYSLSRKYGITVSEIMDLNHLQNDQLQIGQIIKIQQ